MTGARGPLASPAEPAPLDPRLLAIIVCPSCHADLEPQPDPTHPESLRCTGTGCGLVYPVRGGIPVLLVDEAGRGD